MHKLSLRKPGWYMALIIASMLLMLNVFAASVSEPAEESDEPVQEPSFGNEVYFRKGDISAGLYHTLLSTEAGEVYAWGDNSYGQLGIGGRSNKEIPMQVEGLSDIIAVSAGDYHSVALSSNGDVYSWGRNTYGQLGNGSSSASNVPVRVENVPPAVMVSAGGSHTMILGIDGNMYACGMNTYGQVGNVESEAVHSETEIVLGTRVKSPVKIAGPEIKEISAGGNHSLYLDGSGYVFSWGNNEFGQLGDGTVISRADPLKVEGISSVIAISAGYQFNMVVTEHKISAVSDLSSDDVFYRNIYSWGSNSSGQLGLGKEYAAIGSVGIPSRVDINNDQVETNDDVCKISAGYSSSIITVPAGTDEHPREHIYVWGNNSDGQLGIGNMPSQNIPVRLIGASNGWTGDTFLPFQSVSAGGYHIAVLSVKGFAGVAGRADKAQLGNVSAISSDRFIGVSVKDSIAPRWKDEAKLKARLYGDSAELSWEHAADNVATAGYILNYLDSKGETITVKLEKVSRYIIKGFDSAVDQVISLKAFDLQENVGQYPLEYVVGDPQTLEDETRPLPDLHEWSPALYDKIIPLEVPWDVDHIYASGTVDPPKDNSVMVAAIITASVVFFFVIIGLSGFRRTHKGHSIIRGIFRPDKHSEDNV